MAPFVAAWAAFAFLEQSRQKRGFICVHGCISRRGVSQQRKFLPIEKSLIVSDNNYCNRTNIYWFQYQTVLLNRSYNERQKKWETQEGV